MKIELREIKTASDAVYVVIIRERNRAPETLSFKTREKAMTYTKMVAENPW